MVMVGQLVKLDMGWSIGFDGSISRPRWVSRRSVGMKNFSSVPGLRMSVSGVDVCVCTIHRLDDLLVSANGPSLSCQSSAEASEQWERWRKKNERRKNRKEEGHHLFFEESRIIRT